MLTIDALKAYGADTRAGIKRCLGCEAFYLGLVEMLVCDENFELLATAVKQRDAEACLIFAYALADTADSLALSPLGEQLDKFIVCLQVRGDSAVVDRLYMLVCRGLEALRRIQQN